MSFIVLHYIFTKSVQSELSLPCNIQQFFHGCKNDNVQSKSFAYFHIFAQNIDCAVGTH